MVGEIKRMQANWMRERSQNIDGQLDSDDKQEPGTRNSRDKTARKSAQTSNKQGSEWSIGNSARKKPPSTLNTTKASTKQQATLRTRSASPARGAAKTSISTTPKRNNSRPSSARSTTSEGSRPPTGRSSSNSERPAMNDHKRSVDGHEGVFVSSRERTNVQSSRDILGDGYSSAPTLNDLERNHAAIASRVPGDRGDYEPPGHTRKPPEHDSKDHIIRDDHGSNAVDNVKANRPRPKPSLDPDAFDRLADQIASRVKADMRDERLELMNRSGYHSQSTLFDEGDNRPEGYIEAHHCSKCKQLMIPPDHSATLLVPCGHTLCEACAEDRIKCPTCRTRVSSTSLNSTLQEIISSSGPNSRSRPPASHHKSLTNQKTSQDINQNHTSPHSANDHAESHRTHEYTPARYADDGRHFHSLQEGGDVHHRGGISSNDNATAGERRSGVNEKMDASRGRRKLRPEEEARKMEEEYQSLGIRCEALESEEADVLERVEMHNRDIAQHKQQMGNISQKQQSLREEIKGLEKRLADLEGHRQEYKRQVEDAEDRKKEELDQLAMVRTMLRDMQRNRERVKMSARKLNLSLD